MNRQRFNPEANVENSKADMLFDAVDVEDVTQVD